MSEYSKGGHLPGPTIPATLDLAECLVRVDDPTKCIRTQAEHMDYCANARPFYTQNPHRADDEEDGS